MGRFKQKGYKERFRSSVLEQALARYKGMVKADQEGRQPLYRDGSWSKNPENRKKQKKQKDWTKGSDGVIFVQSTPNGALAKKFRETVDQFPSDLKIRIVEKGGQSMKSTLENVCVVKVIVCPAEMTRGKVGIVEKLVLGTKWSAASVPSQLCIMGKLARVVM